MSRLRVLFIGGTGVISAACAREAVARDVELFVLNRGQSAARPLPAGVRELRGDAREPRVTHAADFARGFVPLLGHPRTLGEAFHITSDDVLTWDQIARALGSALGVTPRIVHVPSDVIAARDPEWGAGLLGDKAHSAVFDNAKLRSVVPGWRAVVPFERGAREIADWYLTHPGGQVVDERLDALMDKLAADFAVPVSS
jgi:nucleoside-diphosphate-sugar epimerase